MAKAQWHLFRVRPSNHPVVRISSAGVLMDRYLVPGLVNGLNEAAEPGDPSVLTNALVVKSPGQPTRIGRAAPKTWR